MNPYRSYRLRFTPLSPVHIGTGQSYEPTNYVIEDGILHEFDTGSVLESFSAQDRQGLLDIANSPPDAGMIKNLQRYFFDRRHALAAGAVNRIPVLPGVASLYVSRVGQAAQREGNGSQVLNRLEIDRTAFDPISRKPVLFGSSVKGAIRTALLDQLNNKKPLPTLDLELFKLDGLAEHEQKKRRREQRRVFPQLNEQLFQFRTGKFELDPLRLLQIGDASWQLPDDIPATQVHCAVNRKKKLIQDKDGTEIKGQAEKKDLYDLLECISPWRYRSFSAQANLLQVDDLHDDSAKQKLPAHKLRLPIEAIAKRCSDFYLPILESEMITLKKRSFLDSAWGEEIQQLLSISSERREAGTAFLLRVGKHSGAESVTLNGVRNIKILNGNPEFQPETKTVWLAADTKDQRSDLLPFGWLLVEIQPLDAPRQDWPELKALCEPHLRQARAFAARLEQQAEKLAQARAQAERRRLEEAEQARKKAEEEAQQAREHAERQARLEAMSENARIVEDLKSESQLTPASKGKGKGHQLYRHANQLIRAATDWTPDEQRALRAAAIRVFEHLGVKKDDYKKLIRDLAGS